ncbi:MAG TPA: hypothetical protein VEK79_01700 [Thermoanaerobaculia bacterium]|nr:hypothetical protein [Thermoanaerobaculia bacterium]
MYYTALNWEGSPSENYNIATNYVFLARSSDGINWTKYPSASQPPVPIVTSSVHNGRYGTGQQSVLLKDGVYHMYYTNQPWWNESRIEHRTSSDGVNFGNAESIYPESVVTSGAGTVDVKYIDGWDPWFMVSSGDDSPDSSGVYWNISRDGRHWLPFSHYAQFPKAAWSLTTQELSAMKLGMWETEQSVPRPSKWRLEMAQQATCCPTSLRVRSR